MNNFSSVLKKYFRKIFPKIGENNDFNIVRFLVIFFIIYIFIMSVTQSIPLQLILGHTINGATIAISALGFSLIFGVAKQLKLSVGGYFVLGAYSMYFLVRIPQLSISQNFEGFLSIILLLLPIAIIILSFALFVFKLQNILAVTLIAMSMIISGVSMLVLTSNTVYGLFAALTVILLTVVAWYFELRTNQIILTSLTIGISMPLLFFIGIPTDYISLAILVVLFTGGVAMVEDRFLLDKFRHSQVNVLIITFAVALLLQSIVQLFYFPVNGTFEKFGSGQRSLSGIVTKTDSTILFDISFRTLDLIIFAFSILIMIFLYLFIWHTKLGKSIQAVAQDEEAAEIVGINIRKITAIVSGIGFGLVGFTGVLISPIKAVPFWSPFMGWFILIQVIVVVTLGGLGSLSGTIIASFIYAYAVGLVGIFFPAFLVMFPFLVVFVVIIVKPEGLLGRKKELETTESPY